MSIFVGTTPPSNDPIQSRPESKALVKPQTTEGPPLHPALLSCHSYPGSAEPNLPTKQYKTVPPTPNVPQSSTMARNPALGLLRSSKSDSVESVGSEKGVLAALSPLSGKPPQSPTQTSPRLPRHASFKEKEKEGKFLIICYQFGMILYFASIF